MSYSFQLASYFVGLSVIIILYVHFVGIGSVASRSVCSEATVGSGVGVIIDNAGSRGGKDSVRISNGATSRIAAVKRGSGMVVKGDCVRILRERIEMWDGGSVTPCSKLHRC